VQRIEDGEIALARDAERVLDPVLLELVDEDLTAGTAHANGYSK
jgi:hypothetical protein